MVSLSSAASNRKFERMGMVVLRSTTDCAAVSSRRSSARETVISRFPVGAAVVIEGSWVLAGAASWAGGVMVVLLSGPCANGRLAKLYTESWCKGTPDGAGFL